ncbi:MULTISPECIES: SulP family inorganic anion transporter [Sphingomonadales]|uniref:SulP family inorganic anion transporter n=2 Tax=Edaphosphingomonas TaxID=3423724 RepID=A0A2T4HW85_9SPHN|nr:MULTISPECIES: SulP family inorganic anion transporter [Sphingomonas]AGH48615.1 sulfate transporter [Sphingomonas sp. MM-1]MDX3885607.1 SulP family inorganic anion transporter [Sphingomonas sp.]OHT21092.1 C4-dicarboxylic acid transporter DauA [Sphingomonas haloaromaticamans]PTD20066.1 SulP family inorganic anion transporter [Sphingomonas fennica]
MVASEKKSGWIARDFTASIVVFLVAMPLCMGIAVASGVPPEKGLITGIIGGIVVGLLAGSPLQVSGPAAGLAVIVFEIVQQQGLSALGPILVLAGAIQVVAGIFRLGGWFRAISPAVVHGMLAGIGLLIVVGQFHVLFDAKPLPNGLENLIAIPGRVLGLWPADGHPAVPALAIGLLSIGATLIWEKVRPASMRLVPGALVGVVIATLTAFFLALDVARVDVPESIVAAVAVPSSGDLLGVFSPALLATAFAIAFIASAETLLSAAAVDRMHDGVRTDYNKELRAQGVGNLLCGFAGALPMTGVIVRSSANVQAGAVTRMSAVLHGVWILGFVAALPWLLREIPMAALGGILVVTGWRLVSLQHVRHLFHNHGPLPAVIWAATLVMVVATDLLTGVLVGLGLSLIEIVPNLKRLKLNVDQREAEDACEIRLDGVASFVSLPKLSAALDAVPTGKPVRVNCENLRSVDHTCAEMLAEWFQRRRAGGAIVEAHGAKGRIAGMLAPA